VPGPADVRVFESVVWTGHELVVWGGEEAEGRPTADGASYDIDSGRWRTLPQAPIGPRSAHIAVWTGSEMLVWGGVGRGGQPMNDAAAYDPERRRWRRLPDAPIDATAGAVGAWTGTDLIVWGGRRGVDAVHAGAAYRPRTNRWRRIPAGPLASRPDAPSAWTGCELVVWSGLASEEIGIGSREFTDTAAAYDPRARRWHLLPPAPVVPDGVPTGLLDEARMVWTGGEVILWGYLVTFDGSTERQSAPAAAYDPLAKTWRALPDAPLDLAPPWEGAGGAQTVWAGDAMVVTTGNLDVAGTRTLALDPSTGVWSPLASPPTAPNYSGTLVWTGREVIALGQAPTGLVLR
jgi:hypothetical protein